MYLQSSLAPFSFEQPILAARKTVTKSSRANLSLDLLSFFLQNDSLVFFFNFHFSSVHFIGVFYGQERRFVEFA